MKKLLCIVSLAIAGSLAFAALPVVPAKDQAALLKSNDPKLAKNKKLAYDFFRIVLRARKLDQASKFMTENYMQHNPNADTGLKGFLAYFSNPKLPKAPPLADTLEGLVAIQAEGDFVTLSFVREYENSKKQKYTTTWFDMFRFEGDKIAEHWDSALMQ